MTKNLSFDKVKFFRERLGLSSEQYPTNSLIIRPDNMSKEDALENIKFLLDFEKSAIEGKSGFTHKKLLKLLDELLEEFKSDIDPFFDEDFIDVK
jgi:hypothetical protein